MLDFHHERAYLNDLGRGQSIAGVDEAGRGALAGPIVAAAVIFGERWWREPERLNGVKDSKQLTPGKRRAWRDFLLGQDGIQYGLGVAEVADIERLNVLNATHLAMRRALAALALGKDDAVAALVDGLPVPCGLGVPHRALVKGDQKSFSIAAASIFAKVTRDEILEQIDREYPQYGFARHFGYGTREHVSALAAHGPCCHHRTSFRPVAVAALSRSKTRTA